MKPDKLEQYIKANSDAFNPHEPGDGSWSAIRERIKPEGRFNWKRFAWQAAAAIVIFMSAWYLHDFLQLDRSDNRGVADLSEGNPVNEQMQVLMEAEVYYASRIDAAREEVYRLSGRDEQLMEILNFDLVELEGVFEELKNDLKDDSDNQEVIEAMIQNYRIKLEILEEMLLQLKKIDNTEENTAGHEI
jgi:hypothetical protein